MPIDTLCSSNYIVGFASTCIENIRKIVCITLCLRSCTVRPSVSYRLQSLQSLVGRIGRLVKVTTHTQREP
jgi:hypothetical protein